MPDADTPLDNSEIKLGFSDCTPDANAILDIDIEINVLIFGEDANGNPVIEGSELFSNVIYSQDDLVLGSTIEGVRIPTEGQFEINIVVTQENCSTTCCVLECGSEPGGKPIWKGRSGTVGYQNFYEIVVDKIRCKCC